MKPTMVDEKDITVPDSFGGLRRHLQWSAQSKKILIIFVNLTTEDGGSVCLKMSCNMLLVFRCGFYAHKLINGVWVRLVVPC